MLITEIEDGKLYACAQLGAIKHSISNGVERIISQEKLGDSRYKFTLLHKDGKQSIVPVDAIGTILVVRPAMYCEEEINTSTPSI